LLELKLSKTNNETTIPTSSKSER